MRCYDYKIKVYDGGCFVHSEDYSITIAETDDPEFDRGEANLDAYNHADQITDEWNGDEYTVELTDAG